MKKPESAANDGDRAAAASDEAVKRAMAAIQSRRPDEAERIVGEVLAQNSRHLGALHLLGVALMAQGRAGEAVDEYSSLVNLRSGRDLPMVAIALIVFHFCVPFVVLLSRQVKRQPELLVKVAVAILCVRLIDLFWLIGPEFHEHGIAASWMDLVVPLTLGAIWLGVFVYQLRGRAILPVHDPEFDEALGRIIERGAAPRTVH